MINSQYEKDVAPNYAVPQHYVRHVKRVSENKDISVDYIADEDDIVSENFHSLILVRAISSFISLLSSTTQNWISLQVDSTDENKMDWLSTSIFQDIIDLLESETGFDKEPISLV